MPTISPSTRAVGDAATVDESTLDRLRDALTDWFRGAQRDLPWRRTRDPYAIWVSEIMLQQTRVDTVVPRYGRWLARFPTVHALAGAPLDEVLAEWAGLGYYARARNLHAAAREVMARYGGRVPEQLDEVRSLPGIGRYTAGAVLSLAFGQRAPILDGNVIRVLTRLFRMSDDPRTPRAQRALWVLAERMVAAGDPADVNQGLMELGAMVCTPARPGCPVCPLAADCGALAKGEVERYPAKSRAAKVVAVELVAVAVFRRGGVLLCRRPPAGLYGGLFELPSGEPHHGETIEAAAVRIVQARTGLTVTLDESDDTPRPDFIHVLSHRRIRFRGIGARADSKSTRLRLDGYDDGRFVTVEDARTLGVSRATTKLLAALSPAH